LEGLQVVLNELKQNRTAKQLESIERRKR
jgi:hypothetical protein